MELLYDFSKDAYQRVRVVGLNELDKILLTASQPLAHFRPSNHRKIDRSPKVPSNLKTTTSESNLKI